MDGGKAPGCLAKKRRMLESISHFGWILGAPKLTEAYGANGNFGWLQVLDQQRRRGRLKHSQKQDCDGLQHI